MEKSVQEIVLGLKMYYLNIVFQKQTTNPKHLTIKEQKRCFPFGLLKQFSETVG